MGKLSLRLGVLITALTILFSWTITLTNATAASFTIWPNTAPPGSDAGPDSPVELGVKFKADTAGTITGIRFYKATANTGTHVGNLWSATGALLASATFTNETASGWQQVTFATPVTIAANTVYVASYHANNGHYSETQNFFKTSGVDAPPLHALAEGVSGSNGVYIYGSTSRFPNLGWRSTNYWVDVVFTTTTATDTTPPTVTAFTIPSTSTSLTVPITAFSASDGVGVTGYQVTESATSPSDTGSGWTSSAPVSYTFATAGTKTLYAWAKDAAGNVSTGRSAQVTITAAETSGSIWSTSAVPVNPDAGADSSVEVGVKFRSDTSGYITGIRFYKASTNTGTHVANLWSATGTLLASATFVNETASGWQQVTFPSPVAISANTVYVASYHAAAGHYSFDQNFFTTRGVDNPPLHALAEGVSGGNGVYAYGAASAFPSSTWLSTNYWVDVVFTTTVVADTVAPAVTAFTLPATANTLTVAVSSFTASDNVGVSGYLLTESAGTPSTTAPWSASAPTTYTFATTGSKTLYAWARDAAGNVSAGRSATVNITLQEGGPILIVTSTANSFSGYYAEILRTEGFTFTTRDIGSVTAASLAAYDVVLLGEMTLTAEQVTMFDSWVNAGGNLIAMRPDRKLAGLLGVSDLGSTLANGYLLMSGSAAAAAGLVKETIQYHGTANLYGLNGASSLATLYTTASTATTNPAVTLRKVGTNGGEVATFAFDLARSVVYTRQGNPAWSGQERDGIKTVRSDDLFYGNAASDPQPDWIDLNKVAIPQADEQQRLLANLIIQMNLDKRPLPRFWYFPRSLPAAVIMTGDDHGWGNAGTAGRFDAYQAMSRSGCSVEKWECIRSTSYVFPAATVLLSDAKASAYNAAGFEVALHINSGDGSGDYLTGCSDWTRASLNAAIATQLGLFTQKFPSLPLPVTNRNHCVAWSDYATAPQVFLNYDIRLDTSYYYYPPAWINDRPGFFTGSGIPMRFATSSGSTIDVYQATTQMTDESGQSYPYTIDTLLDRAVGAEGYYGAFTANMHTDVTASSESDAVVASAKARGIPVISARQMLTWLDGRNSSSIGSLSKSAAGLTFTMSVGQGATDLTVMVPVTGQTVNRITINGSSVPFTRKTIKGISYAVFTAANGTCEVVYASTGDTVPPVAAITAPADGATVTGLATVAATATDNVGVTKVEFYLDDTLQATDTTSPYQWSWSSTQSANGPHTLTAVAYDAAGNNGVSSQVPVTVSNQTTTGIALVQKGAAITSSAQKLAVTFPSAVTAGNLIVVAVSGWPNLPAATAVTDSLGNSYTRAGNVLTTQGAYSALYYAANVAGGTDSVTFTTVAAGGQISMAVAEFSGVAASPLDGVAGGVGSGTAPASGAMTPTAAGDLVIGAGTHNMTTVTTAGAGFMLLSVPTEDASTHQPLAMEYQVSGGTQAVTATFGLASGTTWTQNGALFRKK